MADGWQGKSQGKDESGIMKAETFLKLRLCHSSLSFTYNRYENGDQLVRLVCQRLQLISSAKSCSFQQLQPITVSSSSCMPPSILLMKSGLDLARSAPKVCSHGGAISIAGHR